MTLHKRAALALVLGVSLAAAGIAQQSDDAAEVEANTSSGETQTAPEAPTEEDVIAAEDAAVDEVLSETDLVYEEDKGSEDFIPSQQVSADQSLDYPIDI